MCYDLMPWQCARAHVAATSTSPVTTVGHSVWRPVASSPHRIQTAHCLTGIEQRVSWTVSVNSSRKLWSARCCGYQKVWGRPEMPMRQRCLVQHIVTLQEVGRQAVVLRGICWVFRVSETNYGVAWWCVIRWTLELVRFEVLKTARMLLVRLWRRLKLCIEDGTVWCPEAFASAYKSAYQRCQGCFCQLILIVKLFVLFRARHLAHGFHLS
jgi:hypothetical protein